MIPTEAQLLRIMVNANDRAEGKPLYLVIVRRGRERGMAGASVFPVVLSYGASRRLHDSASDYSFIDLPVLIEMVESPAQIEAFLNDLNGLAGSSLVTTAPVRVVRYGPPGTLAPRTLSPRTTPMSIAGPAQRVTVYTGSADTWQGKNLALAIVERCRALGMAGATATQGVLGFGKHSRIHRAHLLGLSEDLPERIEIIDHAERIAELLPVLDEMVGGGLIVVEDVQVLRYEPHTDKS